MCYNESIKYSFRKSLHEKKVISLNKLVSAKRKSNSNKLTIKFFRKVHRKEFKNCFSHTESQKNIRVKVLVPNIQKNNAFVSATFIGKDKKIYLLSNVAMYSFETKTKIKTNICLFQSRPEKCLNLLNILWFIHILQWELFSLLLSSLWFHVWLVPDTLKKRIFLY